MWIQTKVSSYIRSQVLSLKFAVRTYIFIVKIKASFILSLEYLEDYFLMLISNLKQVCELCPKFYLSK